MMRILDLMSIAWWLPDVIEQPEPSPEQAEALMELRNMLKPDLSYTLWPHDSWKMTPNVKRWPHDEGLLKLYIRWWNKVHKAARDRQADYYKTWVQDRVQLRRVAHSLAPFVGVLCLHFFPKQTPQLAKLQAAVRISDFLGWPGGLTRFHTVILQTKFFCGHCLICTVLGNWQAMGSRISWRLCTTGPSGQVTFASTGSMVNARFV
jgi:hypothetical protein